MAWVPFEFEETEVRLAAGAIKSSRPDLWQRWMEHERHDEGYSDISRDLLVLFHKRFALPGLADATQLLRQVRREVRIEAGLPTWDPKRYTDDEIATVIEKIKRERPGLWERFVENEKNMKLREVVIELEPYLLATVPSFSQPNKLIFQLRLEARKLQAPRQATRPPFLV